MKPTTITCCNEKRRCGMELAFVQRNCKYSFQIFVLQIIGKKNNQSSDSDADQEIPILGSTYYAGNSVNLISGILRLASVWDFSVVCVEDQ